MHILFRGVFLSNYPKKYIITQSPLHNFFNIHLSEDTHMLLINFYRQIPAPLLGKIFLQDIGN